MQKCRKSQDARNAGRVHRGISGVSESGIGTILDSSIHLPVIPRVGMSHSVLPEFRIDVLTGQRVLVAPMRSSRPAAVQPDPPLLRTDDPFAEGNEPETPEEHLAIREPGSRPNGPGWKLRVVPNRFPGVMPRSSKLKQQEPAPADVTPRDAMTDSDRELFPSLPAWGEHDVVIECPDARTRLADLSTDEIRQIFAAWRTRFQQLISDGRYACAAVFRNEGFSAGASLAHSHSQIIATELLTPLDSERHLRASQHQLQTGHKLIDDLLNAERADGRRIIRETPEFTVLCPFAPRTSWHVRFVPRIASPQSFADTTDVQLHSLACLLKQTLGALESVLRMPFSFNLILPHSRLDQPAAFPWMLELLPRTGRTAGWEYLSGIEIISVTPEHSAAMLRSAGT